MTMDVSVQGVKSGLARSWSGGPFLWKVALTMVGVLWVTSLANALWLWITGGYVIAVLVGGAVAFAVLRTCLGRETTEKGLVISLALVGLLGLPELIEATYGNGGVPDGPLEFIFASVIMIAYSGAFLTAVYFVLKFIFIGPPSSVEKFRPDVLTDDAAAEGVTSIMNHQLGVYAGEMRGLPEGDSLKGVRSEGWMSESPPPVANPPTGNAPGNRTLRASTEDRAVVIGPPGTGKTVFLVSQVLDWAESGRSLVVLDIKPEIYGITQAALIEKGYEILTYNPTAQTGQRYNPIDDLEGPEALGEMAAALIPSNSTEDAVFNESARDFLDALVSHLAAVNGSVSLPEIRDYIADMSGYKALMRELAQSPQHDARGIAKNLMMTAANERLLGSIFATFQSNLRFLRYPAVRDSLSQSDFSLSRLLSEGGTSAVTDSTPAKPVALFLQFEEQHRETTARLMAFMLGHILRYLITHSDRPAVLLLFDEIGSAPIVPGLVTKLNTIRSRKMPLWMYWQSMEQMQKYGEKANEGPNTILGACDLQMVFRLNDNASAEWMSQRIGVIDREIRSHSVAQAGGEGIGWRSSVSRSLVQEPIIFAHELQALNPSEVVCTYRGKTWRGKAMPYFERWPEYAGKAPLSTTALPYATPTPMLVRKKRVAKTPQQTSSAEEPAL